MANLKKIEADNPKVVDATGRPLYHPGEDLQPRLDEKRAALNERLALIEKQDADVRAGFPPAPGIKLQSEKQAKADTPGPSK